MASSSQEAFEFYQSRHAGVTVQQGHTAARAARLQWLMLALGACTIVLIVLDLHGTLPGWPIGISFALTVIAGFLQRRARRASDRLLRLLALYNAAIDRVTGEQTQSGHTGEEFREQGHLYDRDLGVLGPDSLFGLLATVRTGVGQRGLARVLLHPPAREETLRRQRAIQELTPRNDLREAVHLLGVNQFHQVGADFFDTWLEDVPPSFSPVIRPALVVTSTVLLALLFAGLFHFAAWSTLLPNLLLVVAVQSAIGMSLRSRVLPILNAADRLANQMQIFREGLELLESTGFEAEKLRELQQRVRQPHSAVAAIRSIQRQFELVEQRTKEWYLIPSLLLNAGTHAAISIARWKQRHAAAMQQWLATWAEFEALLALATYAYEQAENSYPEIAPEGMALFDATALAHPMLGPEAVPNDVLLNAETRLYVVSGSNMAGKSTLLRAIGWNIVLGLAGAPVRAARATIAPMTLGASLALSDSLAEGRSKFLAEVERLHAILAAAKQSGERRVLFLIDEIFSGTNSLDRRIAAEAVSRSLIEAGAIGALSTHDLTLTAMVESPDLHARNVHMASSDPENPLAFDYRLKPGVNPSSNALAILRLIGIEVGDLREEESRP